MESLLENKALVISLATNAVLAIGFVGRHLFLYFMDKTKRRDEKDELKVDSYGTDIVNLRVEMAALRATMEMMMKQLYSVEKLEKDLNALYRRIRDKEL